MSAKPTPEPTASPAQLRSVLDQNLTFTLGSEEFGIQVLHIKEITPTPVAPQCIAGLVHLHAQRPGRPRAQISGQISGQLSGQDSGSVIPVADLSLNLDVRPRAYADRTCIVVVSAHPATSSSGHGEILDIASDDIELAPDFGDGAPMPYLLGMARIHGRVKLLQHPIHALLKLAGDC